MDASLSKHLEQRYPTVWDLQKKARKRLPHFSCAYLEIVIDDILENIVGQNTLKHGHP